MEYRVKTEEEFRQTLGNRWRENITFGWNADMDTFLGKLVTTESVLQDYLALTEVSPKVILLMEDLEKHVIKAIKNLDSEANPGRHGDFLGGHLWVREAFVINVLDTSRRVIVNGLLTT